MHQSPLDGGTNENAVSPLSALCAIFRVKLPHRGVLLPFSDKIKESSLCDMYPLYWTNQ